MFTIHDGTRSLAFLALRAEILIVSGVGGSYGARTVLPRLCGAEETLKDIGDLEFHTAAGFVL